MSDIWLKLPRGFSLLNTIFDKRAAKKNKLLRQCTTDFFLLFEHGKQQDISLDVTSADSMCGKRIYTCFLKGILAQLDDSRLSHDN